MAIFRKRARVPRSGQKAVNDARRKNIIPQNSFYVSGGGKEYKDYLESPENRCIAGITIQKD